MQLSLVRPRSRRKGQALILAVLVMLFAVLLSSAFLVVIGNSGRQVGREVDRKEAERNADKGVAFAIAQLRAYPTPDTWDPSTFAGALPANAAEASIYYTALDKAMGWDAQKFVKYPDPRYSRQAPQFLVSSRLLGRNAADDAEGGDKRFMLKITVIGLSSKNPDVWSRRVLYKTTNWNKGTFSYANFVTSFDTTTQKPIVSTLANSSTVTVNAVPPLNSDLIIPVYAYKGQGNERVTYSPRIAEVGNTLMISDGQHQPVVGLVKAAAVAGQNYNLTLRVLQAGTSTTAQTFGLNAKVALVGSLFESPTNIDEDGNGNGVPAMNEGPTKVQQVVSTGTTADVSAIPLGNGAQYNEGLNVPATTTYRARPPVAPYTGSSVYAGQNALVSTGPVSVGDPTPTPVGNPVGVAVVGATPVFVPQVASDQNQFLQVSYNESGVPQVSTANSLTAPGVVPSSIKPAQIDFASYRTKVSLAPIASTPYFTRNATGIYLANSGDVEKFNGQPLTTNQLQRLWQRKSFTVASGGNITYAGVNGYIAGGTNTNAARLAYGRPNPDATGATAGGDQYVYPMTTGGLEARGIRGWISPWEFLPRGAQVILKDTTVTIISDPLSDASSNAPDITKAFDGTTRTFELAGLTPSVICAEGNLRVSGNWNGAPLTIVSNNNIYVEGKLTTRATAAPFGLLPGKLALLAKKNVVLNPTQFVARPTGTVDTSVGKTAFKGTVAASSNDITIPSGINAFKVNDKVAVFVDTTKADGWRRVTAMTATTITVDGAAFTTAGAAKVKLACDPPIVLLKSNPLTRAATGVAPTATQFSFNEEFVADPSNPTPATPREANTQELNPTISSASLGTTYAYKFAAGGDVLARDVPFTNPNGSATNVGIAFDHAAESRKLTFSVQGGEDPTLPTPINDDGKRSFQTRTTATAYDLTLSPKPGPATEPAQPQTFELHQLMGSAARNDAQSKISDLRTLLNTPTSADTETKDNRWRIPLPAAVAPATAPLSDTLAARRLSKVTLAKDFGTQNPDDEADDKRAKFRVPLTSSVLLFNGDLTTTSPTALSPLLTVGSFFDVQNAALPTTAGLTEDPRFIDALQPFYGYVPSWNMATGTNYAQVAAANSAINAGAKPIAFVRDGAGDFNDQLPTYYISAMRFQRVDGSGNSVPAASNVPKTNMNLEVDATIYAEGGSWFIIPVPTPSANNTVPADAAQKIEWRRPSYSITVNGNIAQMMTPTVTVDYDDEQDPDGVSTGAMKRWTDALAYQVNDGTTTNWQTVNYNAAPLPAFVTDAMGNVVLDAQGNATPTVIPQLPSSSDILYTASN